MCRGSRIMIPPTLRKRAVRLSHRAHQGMSKAKALLRAYAWFPGLDKEVERQVTRCLPCQAVQQESSEQPIKPSELPTGPWQYVEMDFQGPYPNGDYIFAMIDRYTRWPEISFLDQTPNGKTTKQAMKHIFINKGIPEVCQSDNGSPFQSHEMNLFAKEYGYRHKLVTPVWPRANGTVERFNRTMKEAIQTAHIEGKDIRKAAYEFVEMYRATPHSATGVSPYAAMHGGRHMKTRLPILTTAGDTIDRDKDTQYKEKMAETRKGSPHTLRTGDRVLIKQARRNKLTPRYDPESLTVVEVKGSTIIVSDGRRTIMRDASHFKKITAESDEEESVDETVAAAMEQPNSVPEEQAIQNDRASHSEAAVQTDRQTAADEPEQLDADVPAGSAPDTEAETDGRRPSVRRRRSPVRYGDYVYY